MSDNAILCEKCREQAATKMASYYLISEEESLEGPSLGDPDYWPDTNRRLTLCLDHYQQLPADARLDYHPIVSGLPEDQDDQGRRISLLSLVVAGLVY